MCPGIVSAAFSGWSGTFHLVIAFQLNLQQLQLILAAHFSSRKNKNKTKNKLNKTKQNYFLRHYLIVRGVTKIFISFRLNLLTLYLPCPTTLLQTLFHWRKGKEEQDVLCD